MLQLERSQRRNAELTEAAQDRDAKIIRLQQRIRDLESELALASSPTAYEEGSGGRVRHQVSGGSRASFMCVDWRFSYVSCMIQNGFVFEILFGIANIAPRNTPTLRPDA